METDSDNEDMDIALFSKKLKVSQKKLSEEKTKTKKMKMKTKDENELLDRASDDKLGENVDDLSLKIQEKPKKRKHKQSENLDSDIVALPMKRTKYKNGNKDNVMMLEDGLSPKKRKKIEEQQRYSSTERSKALSVSKKDQNKLNETIGTSSEESDLETGSIRAKRLKDKVGQKGIKENATKMLKGKSIAEAGSDSDDSGEDLDASSDLESSDSKGGKESDSETVERKSEKNFISNKVKVKQKGVKSHAPLKGQQAKLDRTDLKIKTAAGDTSSDTNTEASDDESLEYDSDSNNDLSDSDQNSSDAVPCKVEKTGQKNLLFKSVTEITHERKKKQKESSKDNATVDDVEEEEKDPYAAIKKELANIPLEDLVKIKDKLGLKVFSQIMQGGKNPDPNKKRVFKRENKNRPMEMSSKRPVPIIRQTHVPKKKVARDPRFDDLSGEYKEEYFERNYFFLQDIKAKEKEVIKKKLLKSKNEEKKEKLQYLLNRMNQQDQAAQQKQRRKEIEMRVKRKEKQLVKEGKNPYFLKKADRKKLELAERYKELQKSGKVDQYLSRKRQKNAQEEKKKLPGKFARISRLSNIV